MDTQRTSSVQLVNGFPSVAPPIQMARLDEPAPDVQCNELRWWFIAPEAGQSRRWATCNALGHELIDIYDLEVLGRTRVHEEECFEIRHRYWGREGKIEREGFAYGDLRDGVTQWFGWWNLSDERRVYTYLDTDFEDDWGPPAPTRLVDGGRFRWLDEQRLVDAGPRPSSTTDPVDETGAGLWQLSVGGTQLRCVRAIEVLRYASGEPRGLCDGFVTLEGKGVLMRRYEAPDMTRVDWNGKKAREVLKDSPHLSYNGVEYRLWYDSLTEDVLAPPAEG